MKLYQNEFKERFARYFDLEENIKVGNREFDLKATYNQRSAQYMAVKNIEIYAFQNNEYVFLKKIDEELTDEFFADLKKWLSDYVDDIVEVNEEHMESMITIIFENNRILKPEEEKRLKKFKFYKSYCLGFRGWVNVKAFYIHPESNLIYANKRGKGDCKRLLREEKN